jgi:hypothetical protein
VPDEVPPVDPEPDESPAAALVPPLAAVVPFELPPQAARVAKDRMSVARKSTEEERRIRKLRDPDQLV